MISINNHNDFIVFCKRNNTEVLIHGDYLFSSKGRWRYIAAWNVMRAYGITSKNNISSVRISLINRFQDESKLKLYSPNALALYPKVDGNYDLTMCCQRWLDEQLIKSFKNATDKYKRLLKKT